MSDVKIEVLKKFRDAQTGEIHLPNDTLEVSNDRLAEIMAVNVHLVRVVDQQPGAPEEQELEAVSDDAVIKEPQLEAVGEDAVIKEPQLVAEEKPKPRRGRKPANNNQ